MKTVRKSWSYLSFSPSHVSKNAPADNPPEVTAVNAPVVDANELEEKIESIQSDEGEVEEELSVDSDEVEEELSIDPDETGYEDEKEEKTSSSTYPQSADILLTGHSGDDEEQEKVDTDDMCDRAEPKPTSKPAGEPNLNVGEKKRQELICDWEKTNGLLNEQMNDLSVMFQKITDAFENLPTSCASVHSDNVTTPSTDNVHSLNDAELEHSMPPDKEDQPSEYCEEDVPFSLRDSSCRELTPDDSKEKEGDEVPASRQNVNPEVELADPPGSDTVSNSISMMAAPDDRDHHYQEELSKGYPIDPVNESLETHPWFEEIWGCREEETLPSFISHFSAMCPDPHVVTPCDIVLECTDPGKFSYYGSQNLKVVLFGCFVH